MLTTGYKKSEGLQAVVRMPVDSDITKRDEKQGYTDVPGSTVQDWVGNLTKTHLQIRHLLASASQECWD